MAGVVTPLSHGHISTAEFERMVRALWRRARLGGWHDDPVDMAVRLYRIVNRVKVQPGLMTAPRVAYNLGKTKMDWLVELLAKVEEDTDDQ